MAMSRHKVCFEITPALIADLLHPLHYHTDTHCTITQTPIAYHTDTHCTITQALIALSHRHPLHTTQTHIAYCISGKRQKPVQQEMVAKRPMQRKDAAARRMASQHGIATWHRNMVCAQSI